MMEGKNERQGEGKMVERWKEEWDERTKGSAFGKRKGNGRLVKTTRIKRK
jgi:hypothetical protein